jgi:transcriptional regulator with XRE-family HTH domain
VARFAHLWPQSSAVRLTEIGRRLGANTRRARLRAGMSQEEVCAEIDGRRLIQPRHYQELEAGRGNPTVRTVAILARLFGVSFSTLMNIEVKEPTGVERRPPQRRTNWDATAARHRRVVQWLAEFDQQREKRRSKRSRVRSKRKR